MKKVIVIISFVVVSLCIHAVGTVYAEDPTPTVTATPTPTPGPSTTPTPTVNTQAQDKLNDLRKEIDELQSKVNDLRSQGKTLASQIGAMDNQIKLTELRINAAQHELEELGKDIELTKKKIGKLETSLKDITKVLLGRIIKTYEVGSVQPIQVLLSSSTASDFMSRANYIKVVQAHDKKLLFETQQAKNDFSNQKSILEDKKQQGEALKAQLEKYTTQLAQDKKDKQALLTITQNNEATYQKKLQAALAEQAAIAQLTTGGGNDTYMKDVNEGDTVGRVISGASACSSGTHLHFEIHNGSSLQDPNNFLSSISFEYVDRDGGASAGQISPRGSWAWPLSGSIIITQGFGMTPWARTSGAYGGGPHTGIDMYSSSSEVRAVKAGKFYRGGIRCGSGTLLYSRVDHSDGVKSYYLHTLP